MHWTFYLIRIKALPNAFRGVLLFMHFAVNTTKAGNAPKFILAATLLAWSILFAPVCADYIPVGGNTLATIDYLTKAQDESDTSAQKSLLQAALKRLDVCQFLKNKHPKLFESAVESVKAALSDLAAKDSDKVSQDITQALDAVKDGKVSASHDESGASDQGDQTDGIPNPPSSTPPPPSPVKPHNVKPASAAPDSDSPDDFGSTTAPGAQPAPPPPAPDSSDSSAPAPAPAPPPPQSTSGASDSTEPPPLPAAPPMPPDNSDPDAPAPMK